MKPTLVFIRHTEINGRVYFHGDELLPDSLEQVVIDKLLDQKSLAEYRERRSLYRLFSVFSGCAQRELLDEQERDAYALP